MRRARVAAIALTFPAVVLAGCTGDDTPSMPTSAPAGASGGTAVPDDGAAATGDGTAATGDGTAATGAAAEDDGTTSTATADGSGEAAGEDDAADAQAAADVAAAFLVAMVNAEPEACDYLLSFTDLERPMTDVQSDHEMCTEILPEILRAEADAQGLDEEIAAELDGLVIQGADVDGDTAVVDGDNYPPGLATSMGDAAMTLKRIDDRWYVDLDNSFAVPTGP
jgi:hypothetical protein